MTVELQDPVKLRGRTFSCTELLQIRAIVEASPDEHRFAISKRVCEVLDWRQANGRLKDRACRDVLLKLDEAGIISLPPRRRPPRRRRPIPITAKTDPRLPRSFAPRDIHALNFSIVTGSGSRAEEALWNEYVERYHYLRYGVPVGAHLKYFVRLENEPIACLAFSGAAWKVAPRDAWIGWRPAQREHNLRFIVNNSRFLILPWIRVDNLASRLLSLALKRLAEDWHCRYAYRPVLVETFVQTERHHGTCYRAANWICAGETRGRGRMDRHKTISLPKKLVFLRPLARNAGVMLAAMPDNPDH